MRRENIYLFLPNLIDYVRVVVYCLGFYLMSLQHSWAVVLYVIGVGLDECDGRAARAYKQESRFGEMVDMLIDKSSLVAIHMALCQIYPDYICLIQFNAALDVSSHWMYTYCTLLDGKTNFKIVGEDVNFVVRFYYGNKLAFSLIVICSELFYAAAYFDHFAYSHIVGAGAVCAGLWNAFYAVCAFFAICKIVAGVAKLMYASRRVTDVDRAERKIRFATTKD